MFLNFGDLGQNAKEYVEQYASKRQGNREMNSIADMKRFVEDYPEFRKLSSNVTKHITLVGELSRRVAQDNLLDVSELEQSLACNDNHSQDVKTLQRLLADEKIPAVNKLRLVALYALRYAKAANGALPVLTDLLRTTTPLTGAQIAMVRHLQTFHATLQAVPGAAAGGGLFTTSGSFFADARSRLLSRGVKGAENVYTQHAPRLEGVLQDLVKGRLRESAFPFVDGSVGGGGAAAGTAGAAVARDKPQDVVVFVVGGATFEEARLVAGVNAGTPGVRIVLAATGAVNSEAFLADVEGAVREWGLDVEATAEGRLRAAVGR
jgi:vacuolar protein sorting-associated protein 45